MMRQRFSWPRTWATWTASERFMDASARTDVSNLPPQKDWSENADGSVGGASRSAASSSASASITAGHAACLPVT